MWREILGRYIRQNQPTLPSWRLPCFNMVGPMICYRSSLIRQPCDFERDYDFVLLQLADTLNTQFKYREGSWHSLLKRLKCSRKSCAKFDSLLGLRKTYAIFRTRLHVHLKQESHAVAGKPRDAAVNSDRYRVRWHFAGAISVSRMQSVSGCTLYA